MPRFNLLIVLVGVVGLGCFWDAAHAQIPEGYELIQITFDPEYYDRFASMNNCGQIAICKKMGPSWNDAEILVYDNGRTTRLTFNNIKDRVPLLNNSGMLVWCRGDGYDTQILEWAPEGEQLIIEAPFTLMTEDLNDSGQLLWTEFYGTGCAISDSDVFIYLDRDSVRLTDGGYSSQGGGINNQGHVVYTRYDFCPYPWESEIHFWTESSDSVISGTDQQYAQVPDINNLDQIVWDSGGGVDYVWFWENGKLTLLSDDGGVPRINDRGDVVFWRWHDSLNQYHAHLWKAGIFYQLTSGSDWYYPQAINDLGEVVIRAQIQSEQRGDFWLLRRTRNGDVDENGRVDLLDYREFARCMTGPRDPAAFEFSLDNTLCDCRFVDLDEDDDVDLTDFSALQTKYDP